MKKILYILSFGLMISLLGCTSAATTKDTAPAQVVVSPTPAPVVAEKKWVVTNTWEGVGDKTTEKIIVSKDTRAIWEVSSDNTGFLLCLLNEKGESEGIVASLREGAGKDTSYVLIEPGEYSVEVKSSVKWKVMIEQKQ